MLLSNIAYMYTIAIRIPTYRYEHISYVSLTRPEGHLETLAIP